MKDNIGSLNETESQFQLQFSKPVNQSKLRSIEKVIDEVFRPLLWDLPDHGSLS